MCKAQVIDCKVQVIACRAQVIGFYKAWRPVLIPLLVYKGSLDWKSVVLTDGRVGLNKIYLI